MSVIYQTEAEGQWLRQRYSQALADAPVSNQQLRVPTREGETFVLACGPEQAPPLVLLHGSGANGSHWYADLPAWSEHFRVYSVDLVGEPGLSAPSRPDLATEASALWLDDVLAGLDVHTTAMVGMSLGGWTALDYAVRRPGRITRLALGCPGGLGAQRRWSILAAGLLMLLGPRARERSVRYLVGLDRSGNEAVLEEVMAVFTRFRPRTEALPVLSDDALRTLDLPLQVTVGDRDRMFDSSETARRVRACVPHAHVRVLPGVGHALTSQTGPVLEFLRGRVPHPG
ncbi:alpha/beta fold hydrolase [Nocardiopsis sp. L17-MgMaSL7]|uniref:alpha/beta fold hydrolase n=1 Tax=Nocardiopsis sp. L17-MgMaSL7 TaxID=1938893 RepID=UPI000D71CF4B|nr:alpha/beta hydrolase [Nocardiopsis sp. L17-MgMaSL7]PWV55011.1 pimeloyl-ACP methyl ester carboxylesterase [Nocardiopsis sp. L17-MgMaSL7]